MSTFVPNRKSFGSKSNKSTTSRKGPVVSSRFLKPTISSTLKKRELNLMKGDDESKSLTETIGKTSTISRNRSPAPIKYLAKSPMKLTPKFVSKRESPAIKPKTPRILPKKMNKSIKENVIKPSPVKVPVPPKNSTRKLVYESKPIEGIDFKFEIPSNFAKKRDSKAAEKSDQENMNDVKFSDITNQNYDAISSTTPLRCITGKSSVVRSSISLLQSINGSGKSTPNITPYKMMRRSKENGKNGDQGITSLEEKIKQLEKQIYESKLIRPDDEDSDQNEFLDGISQIDVKEMIESNKKFSVKVSEPEQPKVKETIVEEIKSIKPKLDIEENVNFLELDNMLGQINNALKIGALPSKSSEQTKRFESITTTNLNSDKSSEGFRSPKARNSSAKSKTKSASKKGKVCRRRRSNRNKKTYENINLVQKNHGENDEWFKDNEVWTRSRKRRKLRETEY